VAEPGEAAVATARALIGTAFRPQGRDPALGLDCVGLVIAVFAIDPALVRRDYRLAGPVDEAALRATLDTWFRRVGRARLRPGDVLLAAPAKRQRHLAIFTGEGMVHADAALRRIVELPGPPPWPIVGVFRRRSRARRVKKG
jgi:cell wall-associated NlpC family hydrolase